MNRIPFILSLVLGPLAAYAIDVSGGADGAIGHTTVGTTSGLSMAIVRLAPGSGLFVQTLTNNGQVLLAGMGSYRWKDGVLTELQSPAALASALPQTTSVYSSSASDMNESGTVVGNVYFKRDYTFAPVNQSDDLTTLSDLESSRGVIWPANSSTPNLLPEYTETAGMPVQHWNEPYGPFMEITVGTISDSGDIYGGIYVPSVQTGSMEGIQDGLVWSSAGSAPSRLGSGSIFSDDWFNTIQNDSLAYRAGGEITRSCHWGGNDTLETYDYYTIAGGRTFHTSHTEGYFSATTYHVIDPTCINEAGRYAGGMADTAEINWADSGTELHSLGLKGEALALNRKNDLLIQEYNVPMLGGGMYKLPSLLLWRTNAAGQMNYVQTKFTYPEGSKNRVVGITKLNDSRILGGTLTDTYDGQGNPSDTGTSVSEPVLLVPAELAVDANRDGLITLANDLNPDSKLSDQTSKTKPFRFWSNDDNDGNAFNEEQEITNPSQLDYASRGEFGIASKRDLEDFARLHLFIGGLTDAISAGKIKIGLRWKGGTVTGSPAINLYRQVEADGGQKYLTDDATAIAQTIPPYSTTLTDLNGKVVINTSGVFILKPEVFAGVSSSKPTYFLFEGAGVGKGMLQMVILDQNNNIIGEGPGTWIDLQSILSMYQRVKVTPRDPNGGIPEPYQSSTTFDAATTSTEASDDAHPFQAPPGETKSALVFVHGSNISYEEAKWNAETMFKRLYWQGYKGRFVLFYWDTLVGPDLPFPEPLNQIPAHYNLNEYRAWKYGSALKQFFTNGLPSGYAKNVVGHSLGNGVIVSALHEGMAARNVVLMQAAMSASCFDSSAPTLPALSVLESPQRTPDTSTQLGYRGVVSSGLNAMVYNMYNPNDFALGLWIFNQSGFESGGAAVRFKPEDLTVRLIPRLYDWSAAGGGGLYGTGINSGLLRTVTDPHESMAFIARSRTEAAGRIVVRGSINESNNLNVGVGFSVGLGNSRSDHSGEFTRRIQQLTSFYRFLFLRAREDSI